MVLDYLSKYYDSGLSLPRYENREAIEAYETRRIARALAVVVVAGSIPRRVEDEIKTDKRNARRLGHALQQALRGWSSRPVFEEIKLDDKIKREGATIEWEPFVESHLVIVQSRLRVISTWSIRKDEHRWGRSAIVRLENELKWVGYAVRG